MDRNIRIVVGVDGSEGGRLALQWALTQAGERNGTVQAVTAWHWEGPVIGPAVQVNPNAARDRAEQILTTEVAAVRAELGSKIPVALEIVEGFAADVLSQAAADADLLVLGSHGHGRVHHAVLGSVSEQCISRARCPVVVLPVPKPVAVPERTPVPAESALSG